MRVVVELQTQQAYIAYVKRWEERGRQYGNLGR